MATTYLYKKLFCTGLTYILVVPFYRFNKSSCISNELMTQSGMHVGRSLHKDFISANLLPCTLSRTSSLAAHGGRRKDH